MRGPPLQYDAIVVGSGFGGAVSACRLAEGGMRVLVLERGTWWGAEPGRRSFPRGLLGVARSVRNIRFRRGIVHRNLVRDPAGLYELSLYEHLDVVTASGVGGGSLVYTNVMEEPEDEFFDRFPQEMRAGEMRRYFDRVRSMLRPAPIDKATALPPKNEAYVRLARAAGREDNHEHPDIAVVLGDPDEPRTVVNAAGEVQSSCNFCGNCVLGCMEGAKTTLDRTYLPDAMRAGAEIATLTEVEGISPTNTGWQVRWFDHAAGRRRAGLADRVVLAAGTLGTLRILLRSRDRYRTLRGLSPRLGAGFSGNGDQGALMLGSSLFFAGEQGPSFNAFIRTRTSDGRHRLLLGEAGIPWTGLGLPVHVARRLVGTHMLLCMGREEPDSGTVTWDGNDLSVDWDSLGDSDLFEEIEHEMDILATTAGASRLVSRLATSPHPLGNATVHPLGGCGMGDSPDTGVTDHRGRVFGADGLHVADGSLYPRASGLPPSMTIAALAERIAELALHS
ncbi:GMC family oxidoreductase [Nitrospirales bacterium NOB]|nr:GMC family oxidoreductase [Nitrospirales bacterium NOB]